MTIDSPSAPPDETTGPAGRSRLRRIGILAGAATVLVLGAGTIAWADSGTANAAAPGYTSSTAPTTPKGTHPAPPKHIPTIDGDVTSVSGTTIVVKDFDGFSRTIVTSSKTVYKDSLTASPAVGTHLHAEGAVDANGTSLDATLVEKGMTGHPGGPGGPADHGDHGGRPGDGHAPPAANGKAPAAPKSGSTPSGSATS